MRRLALLLAACACLAFPQEGKPQQQSKVIRLEHVNGERISNLLKNMSGNRMSVSGQTVVLNGSPEVVTMLEDLIRQIDVAPPPPPPKRSIEIQTYMLLGLTEAADAKNPPELAGVVKQLKDTFPFAGYRLLETMYLRAREEQGGETSGMMPGIGPAADTAPKSIYQCKFNSAVIEETAGVRRIILRNLRFGTKVPFATGKDGSYNYYDLGANLDSVSVREGQKAVIGKAGAGPGKESLFLVLSAKVVD